MGGSLDIQHQRNLCPWRFVSECSRKDVAAIYGYPNGPANLEGAAKDDKVLAYVNRQGLRAVGVVLEPQVGSGSGVFVDKDGQQLPDEYHLRVRWRSCLPTERSAHQATTRFGYNLPVRSVFAEASSRWRWNPA